VQEIVVNLSAQRNQPDRSLYLNDDYIIHDFLLMNWLCKGCAVNGI